MRNNKQKSSNTPSVAKLERLTGQPNIELELLPGRDHTLRPANSQQSAYEILDRALTVELERGA